MKIYKLKVVLMILLLPCRQYLIFAQNSHCSNNINTITTKWDVPGSPNTWNWTNSVRTNNPVYLHANQNTPSTYIDLPWFCNSCPPMGSTPQTHSANAGNYLFRTKQDIYPEDGWELLLKNFGSQNTSDNSNDGIGINNPYFILYNRINGKLKLYVALFGPRSAQAGMVRLGFSTSVQGQTRTNNSEAQRALFNHNEPIAKMVMEFNPVGEFKQMNQVLALTGSLDYQWMVGEFITSYDPCTCENSQLNSNAVSILNMQVVLTETTHINANIDGSITGSTIASGTSVPSQPGGFLAFANAASKSYQNSFDKWESSSKKLTKGIEFINDVLAQHLQRQFYYSELLNNDTLLSANESRKLVKDLMQWPDSVKTVFGVPKPGDSNGEKLLTVIKVIASKIPYVGAAIGVLDFLSNGGDELASPSQVGPVTFNVNLQLDGNITENSAPLTTDFYTPGSPAQSKTQFKPTYNNILGVFNVLELPEMEYAEIIPRNITNTSYDILKNYSNNMFEEDNDCEKGYRDFHGLDGAANVKFRQYRPKSNLKYVLNPASNLEVESIEASFVIEYDKSQNLFIQRPDEFSSSVAFPFHEMY